MSVATTLDRDLEEDRMIAEEPSLELPIDVVEAIVQFAEAAFDAFRRSGRGLEVVPDWPGRWRSQNSGYFHLDYGARPLPPVEVVGEGAALQLLPEYEALRASFEDDPWLRNFVDSQIGDSIGRSLVEFPTLVNEGLIKPLLMRCQDFRLNDAAVAAVASQLGELLMPRELRVLRAVPLVGYEANESLWLSDRVAVMRFSDSDVAKLLDYGLIQSRILPSGLIVRESDRWAVCDAKPVRRCFGDFDPAAHEAGVDLSSFADRFRTAVRLTVGGSIGRGPVLQMSEGFLSLGMGLGYGSTNFVYPDSNTTPAVVRSGSEASGVIELFTLLSQDSVTAAHSLRVPLRRFADARLRYELADVIVDLIVALEALLLTGPPTSEITFRLSLAAALRCELDQHSPSDVRRFVKKAYDVRSTLVHGAGKVKPTRLDGSVAEISDMIHDLEHLVAAGIRHAITEIAAGIEQPWEQTLDDLLNARGAAARC